MRIQSQQQRARRGALAILGAAALVTALMSPAGATDRQPSPMRPDAAKATATGSYVYASATTKSSTGRKLVARLSAHDSSGSRISFGLSLPSGDESHTWFFDPDAGGWHVNGDGKGTLTMDIGDTAGYGKLKVTLTPTGKFKSAKCGGKVSLKTRPIKVKGVYFADSKSSTWGHVGSKTKKSFVLTGTFSKNYDVNCPGGGNPLCYRALSWSTSQPAGDAYEYLNGYSTGDRSYASGARVADIAGSNNGSLSDYVYDAKTAKPVLKVKPDDNATLDVWAGSGSGVLTSENPKVTYKSPCGKNKTQVRDDWYGTVLNGGKPLKLTMQAAAPIVVSDTADSYFAKASVKD